ncbi:MAG: hypothetical protein QGI21_03875 [Candidatus Poseidoniaceae archaeon]|jgi:DNA-directed RNA polymerase subunit RPC12/RpoP|nr:hypothetical protein [Candidatus Poseidoniaceae archaeon]
MSDEEMAGIESRIAPPDLTCPRCKNLLPSGLGELVCSMCKAEVKVEHEITRKKWREEKVSCPECSKVLVCGVDQRPTNLQCAACKSHFVLKPHRPKIEVSCPSCERKLRMNKKPGKREIQCPACQVEFRISF